MKVLVTGSAGFIGFHLAKVLLQNGHIVIGLDSINDYYSVDLKFARLKELGIDPDCAKMYGKLCGSSKFPNLSFVRMALENRTELPKLFEKFQFDVVCNLAAQAGVRYSLEKPEEYIDSNAVGFLNILECCRHNKVDHLVYASSSSVYGLNEEIPFSTSHAVDRPISLYAATKRANELMAYNYSHLFGFRTTGLRFFTVYGPWGRPDMAMFLFTKAIIGGEPISVFNNGELERDFTFIDDIVNGILPIIEDRFTPDYEKDVPYHLYNIGNSKPVQLRSFIAAIESCVGKKAIMELKPMQPGDVKKTWADVSGLVKDYGYHPNTPIEKGVERFVTWYKSFYRK